MKAYKFLENPFWYNLIIKLFFLVSRPGKQASFLDKIFSQQCKGRVLEIGSGTGQFNNLYEKYLPKYFSTDINFDYLNYTKKITKKNAFTVSDSQSCHSAVLPSIVFSHCLCFIIYLTTVCNPP